MPPPSSAFSPCSSGPSSRGTPPSGAWVTRPRPSGRCSTASSDPETARNLVGVGQLALTTTGSLPDDPRPWILAGSSYLVTGQPERALEFYREAFLTGERAEIDLNVGRAYAMLQRADSAAAAQLRAGWISPEILESLAPAVKEPLVAEVARLSEELRQGRLAAPPPLPPEERR